MQYFVGNKDGVNLVAQSQSHYPREAEIRQHKGLINNTNIEAIHVSVVSRRGRTTTSANRTKGVINVEKSKKIRDWMYIYLVQKLKGKRKIPQAIYFCIPPIHEKIFLTTIPVASIP